ncbi:MAG: hydroxymethylglutaryl-CoA lyase [Planctomycetota bacterium]|nr:hydroxymethylglutaryl-CoA lyase [Planctomycetota bacterium]
MSASLPDHVRITEVGPRDGLQNERRPVPTEAKVAFVRGLVAAGLEDIEVSSFVRPDVIPQLADATEVFRALGPSPEGVAFSALVPNQKGMERALEVGVDKVGFFTAATDTFNGKNINCTVDESFDRFAPVVAMRDGTDVILRGYVSVAVWCPYEGRVEPAAVADVTKRLLDMGCDEVSVGDTIGAATPADIGRLLEALLPIIDLDRLVLHLHDTRGMAVASALEGLKAGVRRFDASAGGLGGCPFAPGSAGNLATEDLVFLLDGLGIGHGADLGKLKAASAAMIEHVDHDLVSRVFNAPDLP